MTHFTYSFAEVPTKCPAAFRRVCAAWEQSGKVRFHEWTKDVIRKSEDKTHIIVDFDWLPDGVNAQRAPTDYGHCISFSNRVRWNFGAAGTGFFNAIARIFRRGTDFHSIACHEIGHALGLKHNNRPGSIMQEHELDLPPGPSQWDFDQLPQ